MENELKKLNEYFKMGANLPKNEFAKVFIDVVRKGSSDEIKNAYALLNNLATIPELENFCQKGIEIYKDILKSHLNYNLITSSLSSFKNSTQEIALISLSYSKITDPYFLKKANDLIAQYPDLAKYIKIRKTKKELEEENNNLRAEFNKYQQNYYNVIDGINKYLASQKYDLEELDNFIMMLQSLKTSLPTFKNIIGEETYSQLLNEIDNEKVKLTNIVDLLEEENRGWSI